MKRSIRIRRVNDVNLGKTFSAHLCGGSRGFDDAVALESYSNELVPTIKCIMGFILIVEVDEEKNNQ